MANLTFDNMVVLAQGYRHTIDNATTDYAHGQNNRESDVTYESVSQSEYQKVSNKLHTALGLKSEILKTGEREKVENNTKARNTIDLCRLWMLLRAHIWSVVLWAIGLGAAGFVLAALIVEPKYTSATQILANRKRNPVDAGQILTAQQADIQVANTCKDIVTNPVILEDTSKWIRNPTEVIKPVEKAKYEALADSTRELTSPAKPVVIRRAGRGCNASAKGVQESISITTQQNSQVFTIDAENNSPEGAQAIANAMT